MILEIKGATLEMTDIKLERNVLTMKTELEIEKLKIEKSK